MSGFVRYDYGALVRESAFFAREPQLGRDEFNKPIDVKASTLDEFVTDHSIEYIDLLKIDVQGGEPRVLRGAQKTLHGRVGVVMIEIIFRNLYEQGTSFLEVESLLAPHGFRLFALLRTSDVKGTPLIEQVDAIYALDRP